MVFDAVVLAGGRATRLGGADKAAVEVAGATLLDRALTAVSGADRVVVVGEQRPTSRPVLWTREEPAYGGPVAAAYAGLDALGGGRPAAPVLVLAVDMPHVTVETVERVVGGIGRYDGAVLVDEGRRHLAFAVAAQVLERVRPEPATGVAMRELWARLELAEVPARGEEARDVDVWSDVPQE